MIPNVDIPSTKFFIQIFEYVAYKDTNGISLEPFYSEDCIVNYDNVEVNRSEVNHNLKSFQFLSRTPSLVQDFQRLQDGSMQYFQVDTTIYRVCVDASKNSGSK